MISVSVAVFLGLGLGVIMYLQDEYLERCRMFQRRGICRTGWKYMGLFYMFI